MDKPSDNVLEERSVVDLTRMLEELQAQVTTLQDEIRSLKPIESSVDKNSYLENYEVPQGHFLAIRTSVRHPVTDKVVSRHDLTFEWPEEPGALVTDPSYDEDTICGKGLHGLKWGIGNLSYLDTLSHLVNVYDSEHAVWQVVCVPEDLSVSLRGKVKFRECRMVLSTSFKQEAFAFINKHAPKDLIPELSRADNARVSGYTNLADSYGNEEFLELPLGPLSNVYTSKLKSGNHAPAIDIDVPAEFIPSSTEGHGHLKFDVEMTWEDYQKLLLVMVEVGIVEKGFYEASVRRGSTFLRLPWIKKSNPF